MQRKRFESDVIFIGYQAEELKSLMRQTFESDVIFIGYQALSERWKNGSLVEMQDAIRSMLQRFRPFL